MLSSIMLCISIFLESKVNFKMENILYRKSNLYLYYGCVTFGLAVADIFKYYFNTVEIRFYFEANLQVFTNSSQVIT